MTFSLTTIKTASGPRAAIVVGDKVLDIANATGKADDASMLNIRSEEHTSELQSH